MRLETEDGHFVADVRPMIEGGAGTLPDDVVLWGLRVFRKVLGERGVVWKETLPLSVVTNDQD